MVRYGDISFPISYEVIKKDIPYCDLKTKKERRKSSTTKNTHFRNMLAQAKQNQIKFQYVLAEQLVQ